MKKSYYVKRVEKILRDFEATRHSLLYLNSISGTSAMSLRKEELLRKRILYLSRTVVAVERSLEFLTPIEKKVICGLYLDPNPSFDRVCETCALEKSSVYRYRSRALEKLSVALFGE